MKININDIEVIQIGDITEKNHPPNYKNRYIIKYHARINHDHNITGEFTTNTLDKESILSERILKELRYALGLNRISGEDILFALENKGRGGSNPV